MLFYNSFYLKEKQAIVFHFQLSPAVFKLKCILLAFSTNEPAYRVATLTFTKEKKNLKNALKIIIFLIWYLSRIKPTIVFELNIMFTALHQNLFKYLTAQDTCGTPTLIKHNRTLARLGDLLYLQPQSTITISMFSSVPYFE